MADFDIDISEIAEEDSYAVQGGVRNYVADEGIATVPRRWKSRPGQPETQLAYITDEEAALLKKENIHKKDNPEEMGTVNVGPDGVPSYDDSGMGDFYGGADESAYESASQDVLDALNPTSQNVLSAVKAQALTEQVHQQNLAAAAATRKKTPFGYGKGEDPGVWSSFFPPITRFGRHSGDFGIPDDIEYRDFQFGRDLGFPMGLTSLPLMAYKYNRYLQRKNPHLERAEAMKGQDPTKFEYGPSWLYGQPKPKDKDYGDGGPDALLKKRLAVGAVPSAVATPQGIVSGDPIFGGRTKTFTGFDPNAATAGARGAFQYFQPVVAQRGGLLDAAEIQRFQTGGKPKRGFFGQLLGPAFGEVSGALKSVKDRYTPNELMNNDDDRMDGDSDSRNKDDGSIVGGVGNALGDVAGLLRYGTTLLELPGAIAQNPALRDLFTSDPQIDPGAMPFTSPEGMRTAAQQIQEATRPDFVDRTYWFGNPRHGHGGIPTEVVSVIDPDSGRRGEYAAIEGAAIDTTGAFDRGGPIRASDLAGDYGTMNRMISDPRGIASLGRGGDTMLVHMRPDEVAAMSRDGRTTVNPHTGLPERFLGAGLGALAASFLPASLIGASPWAMPLVTGLGAAAGGYGQSRMQGRSNKDALMTGLYSGLGAGITSGVMGAMTPAKDVLAKDYTTMQQLTKSPFATAGISGLAGGAAGEMGTPLLPIPEKEPITQRQAIARPKSARGISGDPATYGSGAEQYLLSRNKGIFDYTFAQEGGLMEAAQEEEVVETSPDGVEMAYLQEDAEVMTPPGIPGMEEGMDIVVKEAVMAIRGEHPEPERAIAEYIEIYGEEDFAALQEMVTQDQTLEGMGEAPVEVAETSETVEEMPLMAARGGALNGPGKGRDDQIPVLASDGEYIIAADVVSGLGDGSTKAGAQTLDAMADRVRQMRTGTQKQPEILPEEMALPA